MKPALLLALVFASTFAWSAAHALPRKTWVISIGNNTGDGADATLLYAESDARAFATVMRRVGGVSSDRVRLILDADAVTTRRTLATLNAQLREANETEPTGLVVYYSGHADADALHLAGTALPFDELRNLVKGSPASLRLLIVDACRSGGVSRVKGGSAAAAFAVTAAPETVTEGFAVLTSSAAGEASQESDLLKSSFFSHHLMNAMRGAGDHNGVREVTLSEAYEYAYSQTLRSSGHTLNRQHPTYAFDVKGRGGLVLSQLDAVSRGTATLQLREAAIYRINTGRDGGPLLAEVAAPRDEMALLVPSGSYFVQQRLAREFREFNVKLGAGETLALRGQPFRSVEYDRLVRKRGGPATSVHGLSFLGGARGEVLVGEGISPHLVLGYRLDLPWFSAGVRGRLSSVTTAADGGLSTRRRDSLGVGLTLERFVALSWSSIGFGLLVEAAANRQVFDTLRDTPDRHGTTASFGGLFAIERHLAAGIGLRVEGGPLTVVFREGRVEDGAQVASKTESAFVWWTAVGLTWRL